MYSPFGQVTLVILYAERDRLGRSPSGSRNKGSHATPKPMFSNSLQPKL